MIKTVDKNWLMRRAKAIETRNLQKYGTSTAWIMILNRLNACIVCTHDDCMDIDTKRYGQICNLEMAVQRHP